jgi:protein-tyrosine-phosphatase
MIRRVARIDERPSIQEDLGWRDPLDQAEHARTELPLQVRLPVFRGKPYLDWELPDPAGKSVKEVAQIHDEIDQRVRDLLAELVGARG